ncbi:MAG: hypothetical protein L0312_20420, partial [Acidobacteria bacterium]|nr:hypothetical protein [Acidobacteriota bacterium]
IEINFGAAVESSTAEANWIPARATLGRNDDGSCRPSVCNRQLGFVRQALKGAERKVPVVESVLFSRFSLLDNHYESDLAFSERANLDQPEILER